MRFEILTIFPEIIEAAVSASVLGRARQKGLIEVNAVNLRDFTEDAHRTTDDEPYGGGPGMVMKCEPVFAAVEGTVSRLAVRKPRVMLMTPQGARFDQKMAEEFARESCLVMNCGRYEGVDERIRTHLVMMKSPSVITSSREGSLPRWLSWMRFPGWLRGSSATRRHLRRNRFPAGCWSMRNIPGPRISEVLGCPRYCFRAITPK